MTLAREELPVLTRPKKKKVPLILNLTIFKYSQFTKRQDKDSEKRVSKISHLLAHLLLAPQLR